MRHALVIIITAIFKAKQDLQLNSPNLTTAQLLADAEEFVGHCERLTGVKV